MIDVRLSKYHFGLGFRYVHVSHKVYKLSLYILWLSIHLTFDFHKSYEQTYC